MNGVWPVPRFLILPCGFSVMSWKDCSFFIELLLLFGQRLTDRFCVGLFLGFLLSCLGPFVPPLTESAAP